MWTARTDSKFLGALLALLIATAWLALATSSASLHGSIATHEDLQSTSFEGYLPKALVFLLGWSVMTVAMMLPTSLPLVLLFRTITQKRRDGTLLLTLLLSGYLAVWLAFGAVAHVADFGIHRTLESTPWLHERTWLLTATPLLLAGAYQFTPLKYFCLDKCRSPYSFVVEHWQGGSARKQALALGIHHGAFCVGCCWSLMLLMFALSAGSLVWMLALAALMAIEKNVSWGRQISTPVGGMFLSAGLTVVLLNL
jgi:predicted metal-binding membrane protein